MKGPNMDQDRDQLFRSRVKLAIQRGGGVSEMSAKTGIPKGTLKKYVAETSTASFVNAAKISVAAGLPLEVMAFGTGVDIESQMGPAFDRRLPPAGQPVRAIVPAALRQIRIALSHVYDEAGMKMPSRSEHDLAVDFYNEFVMDNIDLSDPESVAARIVLLKKSLHRQIAAAKEAPGTGKLSA